KPARSSNERFCNEVPHGQRVDIAIIAESIEFVALLPVFDPNLLVAHGADEDQVLIQMDVVFSERLCEGSIASQVVIVISHHHRDPDASPSGPELVENCLVRLDYVFKLVGSVHEGEFPETKSITHDEQLGVGALSFQSLQKSDELSGVIAMLQ